MTHPLVLGIDIGGTNTIFGIVNQRGEVLSRGQMNTRDNGSIDEYLTRLYNLIFPEMEKLGFEHFVGVGVGVPNGNYFTGEIIFAPNLPWQGVIPLAKLISAKFRLPTIITNDANAAAYGEMMYGAAKGMQDFLLITLGTGVGSGFIANGKIINGHDGFAGELGHVIIDRNGRRCGCGRNGCLETYASATGVAHTAKEMAAQEKSSLSKLTTITSEDVYNAAQMGDEVALAVFKKTADYLGFALANAVAISSPQAIILFGGLANAGSYLLQPLSISFEGYLLKIYKNKIQLLPSTLPENDAAILGASALAW